jgi:hypothetical protein
MFQPAHVDGRSLVILRRRRTWLGWRFSVVASGLLEHDGEILALVDGESNRVITEQELAEVLLVKPDTRIAECRGFDLFLIQE